MSKTGLQLMKEDTTQRTGDSAPVGVGVGGEDAWTSKECLARWWAARSPTFGRDWLSREIGKSSLQFEGMRVWVCVCQVP